MCRGPPGASELSLQKPGEAGGRLKLCLGLSKNTLPLPEAALPGGVLNTAETLGADVAGNASAEWSQARGCLQCGYQHRGCLRVCMCVCVRGARV